MSVSNDVNENDFMSQLDSWLSHNPNEACSKGGHAAYGSAVYQVYNDTGHQDRLGKRLLRKILRPGNPGERIPQRLHYKL